MTIDSKLDDPVKIRSFQKGDTVRSRDNPDKCTVIGARGDWLWLDPIDYLNAAPFTGRADDFDLVKSNKP
jgi:hypothetical protein